MQRFSDQVAIVTGAARGIGKAIAHRLAQEGARVFLMDLLEEPLHATTQEIQQAGFSAHAIAIDISVEDQVQKAMDTVQERAGQIDILVNSAGIIGHTTTSITD